MNYTQLTDAIKLYAENYEDGFISSVDGFIMAAEQRIFNLAKLPASNKETPGSLVSGSAELTLPIGFLAMNELAVVNGSDTQYLLNKDVSFLREAYPSSTSSGVPKYYAQADDTTLYLAPTPASTYPYIIRYFAYPESIVTAGTTWLGDNFDQCLLYGALQEASVFMKGETETLAMYKERFDTAMALLFALVGRRNNTDFYRAGRKDA